MSDDYEAVMLVITEVNVYRIPPRQTSRGYRASDWDVTQHLWTGRLKITASSTKATIRFEDPTTGDLFAVCPYDPNGTSVEPVQDSSRYFVVRIVDQGSGQHAFVGVGFAERGWAFDFNVALQEFST
ncbi:adaptin ear-binding coat-associated protein 1 NECAP-1 [Powellomyces hirtus]|nr:adaptin ear-binding coat-associated protein 1 NECAP-1 [Powellomyces hirtus]